MTSYKIDEKGIIDILTNNLLRCIIKLSGDGSIDVDIEEEIAVVKKKKYTNISFIEDKLIINIHYNSNHIYHIEDNQGTKFNFYVQ